MGLHCETCNTKLHDRKNRFCKRHALQTLRHLESVGYLQPLTISTVNGSNERISRRRFLTLREGSNLPE